MPELTTDRQQASKKQVDCCHRFKAISKLGLCGCYGELGEHTKLDLGRQGKTNFRTVIKDGEPWFVGKDVAEILGYSNTKDAISTHIDEDDRTVIQRSHFPTFDIPTRGLTLINESGLYSLILGSKLPNAGSLL